MNIIDDFMGEIALLGFSVAVLTGIELILVGSVVFSFILVPVGIAIELAVVGILLSDANGGDYGKAVYDSLTSIALNCI